MLNVKLTPEGLAVKVDGAQMQEPVWQALQDYVDAALVALKMTHCTVKVAREYATEDVNARISLASTRMYGYLEIGNRFFLNCRNTQRRTIAHELFHVLDVPLKFFVRERLEHELSPRSFEDFCRTFNQLEELLTDHVCQIFAEVLPPMPDIPQMVWALQGDKAIDPEASGHA